VDEASAGHLSPPGVIVHPFAGDDHNWAVASVFTANPRAVAAGLYKCIGGAGTTPGGALEHKEHVVLGIAQCPIGRSL